MIDHLEYEISQMRRAAETLSNFDGNDPAGWLIAEAGLIHARNLIEFLFYQSTVPRPRQSPTARAVWYTKSWSPHQRRVEFERHLDLKVTDVKRSIDRRVCHLASDRNQVERAHFLPIAEATDIMWRAMHANLRPPWDRRLPR